MLPLVLAGLLLAGAPVDSTVVLNLEPSPEFPRHSEGAFATLADGRILFVYTRFTGGAEDHSSADLVGLESADGGQTWGPPRVVVANEGRSNVMSVSLLRLAGSGRLALFYLLKNSFQDCQPYLRYSSDEGATWSEAHRCGRAPGYFVLNNDRVIQLRSGRLVMPLGYHRSRGEEPDAWTSFDGRAIAMWLLSDDEGATWREARTWWALPVVTGTGMQEPGVVELDDGSLLTVARTDQGRQWECRSTDGGETWTAPVAGPLQSPVAPATLKTFPGTATLLAVYCDHSGAFPFPAGKRTPLVAALSDDRGTTWHSARAIETDPDGWYCYTAMHFVGEHVLLAYCAGDSQVGGLNRLRIRRVGLGWLYGAGD